MTGELFIRNIKLEQENEELKDQLSWKGKIEEILRNDKIKELEKSNEELSNKLCWSEVANEKLTKENVELDNKMKKNGDTFREVLEEKTKLERELSVISGHCAYYEKTYKEYKKKLDDIEKENIELKEQLKLEKSKILQIDFSDSKLVNKLENKIKELEEDVSHLETDNIKLEREKYILELKIKGLYNYIAMIDKSNNKEFFIPPYTVTSTTTSDGTTLTFKYRL